MKKLLALLLTVTMLCGTAVTALAENKDYPQRFYDVPKDHWAFEYISELVDRGVIAGYEDGSFRPSGTVTRAEFAKIMVCAASVPTADNNVYFTDMQNHWAVPYVNAAENYLTAYSDNTYRPDQAAVREDVTMAMVRLKGYDVSNVDFSYLSGFTDTDSISNNIKAYVAVAVEKGLISGFEDNTFRGQGTLTRAEAATLLWKAFQYGSDNKVIETPAEIAEPISVADNTVETTKTTPKPTAKPTPKPTEKPELTEKPTPEPTEEPTPTPKPYSVDTIAKANVENSYSFTFDNDDTIYYIDGSEICSLDIDSGATDVIADLDDLTVDNDEMTLSDFEASSICWDNNNDRILFTGKYNEINSVNKVNNQYLCEIADGDVNVITDNFADDSIIGTLSNGDYVSKENIFDAETFKAKTNYANSYTPDVFIESNNGIYYIGYYYYVHYYSSAFCSYDFLETEHLWYPDGDNASGIKENKVVTFSDDEIQSYNFNGKKIDSFKDSAIQVNDKSALNFDNIKHKLLITDNDDIIFYDETAKAFRIISEND
ncbi:MAG: S-layer homology domain-containing protein [Clostridia bacterium]|nr:S-layer homology domain-containing protein [Clostridia bacterium]